jgi:hypothetical protein
LGNPRLGFVCTSLVTDAGAGLVGYYIEEDRELQPDERLRFAPAESPPGPAGDLPSVDWTPERLAKVERNYAMEYVRSILPELCAVLGPADAGHVGRTAGRQVAMQYHDELCGPLSSAGGRGAAPPERSPESFARLLARLSKAQSDRVTVEVAASGHEAFGRSPRSSAGRARTARPRRSLLRVAHPTEAALSYQARRVQPRSEA